MARYEDKVGLGDAVVDDLTGFSGTVTGICFYITGCTQALVKPAVKDDGEMTDGAWIDTPRLSITKKGAFKLDPVEKAKKPGGPARAPIRH